MGDARTLYRELSAVAEALGRIEAVEPPPSVRRGILEGVAARSGSRTQPQPGSSSSVWTALRSALGARPRLALAYAFVLGLAVGLGAFAAVGPMSDSPHTFGTIAPSGDVERAEAVTRTAIDAGGVRGTLRIATTTDLATADLLIEAAPPSSEVTLAFDAGALQVLSVAADPGTGIEAAYARPGRITLTVEQAGGYRVTFGRRTATPPELEVRIADTPGTTGSGQ